MRGKSGRSVVRLQIAQDRRTIFVKTKIQICFLFKSRVCVCVCVWLGEYFLMFHIVSNSQGARSFGFA